MIDKSSLLKSQGSLYLEFIPKDGLLHKMLLLSLMGILTGWCNLKLRHVMYVCAAEVKQDIKECSGIMNKSPCHLVLIRGAFLTGVDAGISLLP